MTESINNEPHLDETPLSFTAEGEQLAGVVHPGDGALQSGVLIVVGGPQYRVGSHRQFVQLARALARAGIPCMRFDVIGMGDSSGRKKSFEVLDSDIAAAVAAFQEQCPNIRNVVLWGLCDGASAALMYAPQDARISGLVLVNPWLEDDGAKAQATLVDYYAKRLFSRGLWEKLFKGDLAIGRSLKEFFATFKSAAGKASAVPRSQAREGGQSAAQSASSATGSTVATSVPATSPDKPVYQQRMKAAFAAYEGAVLLLLSGEDLTAKEFDLQFRAQKWRQQRAAQPLQVARLPEADHTFSSRTWKAWCEAETRKFVESL